MTPQDQQMIDGLIDRIRSTQITDRDPDAAARLQQGLGGNADAIYILAQTVLVQQHSLEQAHTQLDQMEAELAQRRQMSSQQAAPQAAQPTSWLDRFFGNSSAQAQPGYPPQAPQPAYSAPPAGFQPVNTPPPPYGYPQQPYPQGGYAPQAYPPPQGYGYGAPQGSWGQSTGMGGGSFLRNAAQTAAGVAAGEMLFQGVESMFGGHHEGYGGGREHESVVNNYYEDRGSSEHEHRSAADTDSNFYNPTHDASRDDQPSAQNFADTTDTTDDQADQAGQTGQDSFDDNTFDDDSSSDDSGADDFSSSDDTTN